MQHTLQHQATSNLTDPGLCSPYQCPCYRHKENLKLGSSLTFSSLAFTADVIVVGLMNWKDGAALLGYCAGNVTSILTRWLLQCTDTVQLLSAASICKAQVQDGDKLQRIFKGKHIYLVILCCILFAVLSLKPEALNRRQVLLPPATPLAGYKWILMSNINAHSH